MAVGGGNINSFIYSTEDGGQSWTKALNINGGYVNSVAFSSATNGVAVVSMIIVIIAIVSIALLTEGKIGHKY